MPEPAAGVMRMSSDDDDRADQQRELADPGMAEPHRLVFDKPIVPIPTCPRNGTAKRCRNFSTRGYYRLCGLDGLSVRPSGAAVTRSLTHGLSPFSHLQLSAFAAAAAMQSNR